MREKERFADERQAAERRSVVIANPNSGSAGALPSVLGAVEKQLPLTTWTTEGPGHARELARRAVTEGFGTIVAAGGDGTIHEIVNGIAPDFGRAKLAVLPLGTGNDFCRYVEAELDPAWILAALRSESERAVDVLRAHLDDGSMRYAINTVSAGFGGVVTEHLDSDLKARFGPLAFLFGLRDALPELTSYDVTLVLDERETRHVTAAGIVLANGATIAGGLRIAPGAKADDGMMDIVVLDYSDPVAAAALMARAATGAIATSELVTLFAASRVRVQSEPAMPYSLDGELLDAPPRLIELLPRVLRLAVPAPKAGEGA